MNNASQNEWWLVEIDGTRDWVRAHAALPAVVGALDRRREDHFATSGVEVFYATRSGANRVIAVDADLALERAGWAPHIIS